MKKEEAKLVSSTERPPKTVWRELFKTAEGHILLFGIAIAFAGLIVMGAVAIWSPPTSEIIGAMSFTNLMLNEAAIAEKRPSAN